MEYKYQLQKYTGRSSRHICPNCGKRSLTLYIDTAGKFIDETVGRCDHESSCGYHLTPKQYFEMHPTEKREYHFENHTAKTKPQQKKTDYIPFDMIQRSQSLNNTLMDFLKKYWSVKELQEVTAMYHLGCTKKREIIFPQISIAGMCHTGKVMQYDKDGHRIKKEFDCVDWLHSRLMRAQGKQSSDFNLKQVLFGEHLLSKRKDAVVAITESEKSAVICALTFPAIVWVSCGGKNGLNIERCRVLRDRNVVLYPDADAVDLWTAKAKELKATCKSIRISDWHKSESQDSKRDIADLILTEKKMAQQEPTTIGQLCQWLHEMGVKPGSVIINV